MTVEIRDPELAGPAPSTIPTVMRPEFLKEIETLAQRRHDEAEAAREVETDRLVARVQKGTELEAAASRAIEPLLAEVAACKAAWAASIAKLGRAYGHRQVIVAVLLDDAQQLRARVGSLELAVDRDAMSEQGAAIYRSLPLEHRGLFSSAGVEGRELTREQLAKILP